MSSSFIWMLITHAVYLLALYFMNQQIQYTKKTMFLKGYMRGFDDFKNGNIPKTVCEIWEKMEKKEEK